MACSKFSLNVSSKWLKLIKNSVDFPVDEDLYAYDQLEEMSLECGLFLNKDMVRKFCDRVCPYRVTQSLYPVIPDNTLCREAFKNFVHHSLVLYRADDLLETLPKEQKKSACGAFARLNEKCRESFPNFPTIGEIKGMLQSEDKAIIPPIVAYFNSTIDVAKTLLEHGDCSLDVVFRVQQRMTNAILLYLKSIVGNCDKIKGTVLDAIWHRAVEAGSLPFFTLSEILTETLGKTEQYMHIIKTIGLFCASIVPTVNDVFSYDWEKVLPVFNFFGDILKENSDQVEESLEKAAKISDALYKRMFRRIRKIKSSYPQSKELHSVLDTFEIFATGACVMHWWLIPKYQKSTTRYTFVELDDDQLSKWLDEKEVFGETYADKFEELFEKRLPDGILEALCGNIVVNPATDSRQEIGSYYLN